MSIVGDKLREAIAETTPTDALHLIAELAQRLPCGVEGPYLNLGYSDEGYALLAEMPERHLCRTPRMVQARIGGLAVTAHAMPAPVRGAIKDPRNMTAKEFSAAMNEAHSAHSGATNYLNHMELILRERMRAAAGLETAELGPWSPAREVP